ncbi:MAG: hypothetical protein QOF61_2095, partial [Acidobacteriota bacterium]|nr:hypothetical protein [Acidobacteriota bacterium]
MRTRAEKSLSIWHNHLHSSMKNRNVNKSIKRRRESRARRLAARATSKAGLWVALVLIITTLCAPLPLVPVVQTVKAASPASGTIAPTGPVPTFTGTWTGTATGTGSANGEATCVEGVNCDTFRLTVAPGDYTGKFIAIKIQWTVAANDYDLYLHKCPTPAS